MIYRYKNINNLRHQRLIEIRVSKLKNPIKMLDMWLEINMLFNSIDEMNKNHITQFTQSFLLNLEDKQ